MVNTLSTDCVRYEASFETVQTEQDGVRLFIGFAKAKDLVRLTTVDLYDPNLKPEDPEQGYQRPPERSRITRIGKYLMSGDSGSLFPTAVLLAARKPLVYDRRQGTVSVTSDQPLQIVDGQHRLAGMKYAIEEKGAAFLGEHSIPIVIMESPDRISEMTQFLVVNGTAKQVRTDLVNMILTATYAETERGEIPRKDLWRIVVSNVVDRLAKDLESPWYGLVVLPGESNTGGAKPIRATSLITSLRPVYVWLKEASGILDQCCRSTEEEIAFMYDLVANYWRALADVAPAAFEDPTMYVIQKTPGVFSLHTLLRHLMGDMYRGRRLFDRETFVEFLSASPEIPDAGFWHRDSNRASVYGSMKGFQDLYEILAGAYV